MLVHERLHTVEPFALTVRHVEVHWAFLAFLNEIVGGTVSPPPVHRKTISSRCRGVRRGVDASCALTFRPSNHSFIHAFELQSLFSAGL
jgi:hypothetical protein